MEWVEVTAKTVDEARNAALDQLGVGAEEAEFDVVAEPKPGLFGRMRGEARVRARIRPAQVRPKQDRRRRSRQGKGRKDGRGGEKADNRSDQEQTSDGPAGRGDTDEATSDTDVPAATRSGGQQKKNQSNKSGQKRDRSRSAGKKSESRATSGDRSADSVDQATAQEEEKPMSDQDVQESPVTPEEVGAAAVAFMEGLTDAFDVDADVSVVIDGTELDVSVQGSELGLLVGPGGRTLNAVQDLARVAAQRRLGDHDTRLRIDVAGYRERRQLALGDFARRVAETVRATGEGRSMEPMTSSDRKVVHDVLNDEEGVTTRSVGEDPDRRIVVEPA